MSFPFFILLASILTSILAAFFRNQKVASSLIAASGAALLAVLILFVPLDEATNILGFSLRLESKWVVLGRALSLDPAIRPMVGFLYLTGLYLFSGSWLVVRHRFFPSIASLMLATVASSLMVEPFLYASAFIGLAAMGSVLLLVSRDHPRSVGAVRLMVLYTFAVLAILLSGWMIETGSGTVTSAGQGVGAGTILGFGFAILMAIPPFHIWLTSGVKESNNFIVAFVTIILQSAGFFFLLRFLDAYSWLREDPLFSNGLRSISIATIVLATFWALSALDLRRIFAYAVVADMGVILLALSQSNTNGIRISLALFGARVFSIAVFSLGLCDVERGIRDWRGAGRKNPVASLALLGGLLSLAGFPLTPGFPGRWALLSLERHQDPLLLIVIIISLVTFALIALRWATVLFDPTIPVEPDRKGIAHQVYLITGISSLFVLGIAPQILIPWVVEVAAGLTNLFP